MSDNKLSCKWIATERKSNLETELKNLSDRTEEVNVPLDQITLFSFNRKQEAPREANGDIKRTYIFYDLSMPSMTQMTEMNYGYALMQMTFTLPQGQETEETELMEEICRDDKDDKGTGLLFGLRLKKKSCFVGVSEIAMEDIKKFIGMKSDPVLQFFNRTCTNAYIASAIQGKVLYARDNNQPTPSATILLRKGQNTTPLKNREQPKLYGAAFAIACYDHPVEAGHKGKENIMKILQVAETMKDKTKFGDASNLHFIITNRSVVVSMEYRDIASEMQEKYWLKERIVPKIILAAKGISGSLRVEVSSAYLLKDMHYGTTLDTIRIPSDECINKKDIVRNINTRLLSKEKLLPLKVKELAEIPKKNRIYDRTTVNGDLKYHEKFSEAVKKICRALRVKEWTEDNIAALDHSFGDIDYIDNVRILNTVMKCSDTPIVKDNRDLLDPEENEKRRAF